MEEQVAEENGLNRSASYADVPEEEPSELTKIRSMLTDKWINTMLIFVPAGFLVNYMGFSETTIFVVNFLAMVVSLVMLMSIHYRVAHVEGGGGRVSTTQLYSQLLYAHAWVDDLGEVAR